MCFTSARTDHTEAGACANGHSISKSSGAIRVSEWLSKFRAPKAALVHPVRLPSLTAVLGHLGALGPVAHPPFRGRVGPCGQVHVTSASLQRCWYPRAEDTQGRGQTHGPVVQGRGALRGYDALTHHHPAPRLHRAMICVVV